MSVLRRENEVNLLYIMERLSVHTVSHLRRKDFILQKL